MKVRPETEAAEVRRWRRNIVLAAPLLFAVQVCNGMLRGAEDAASMIRRAWREHPYWEGDGDPGNTGDEKKGEKVTK